jgi:hypothetical protein
MVMAGNRIWKEIFAANCMRDRISGSMDGCSGFSQKGT